LRFRLRRRGEHEDGARPSTRDGENEDDDGVMIDAFLFGLNYNTFRRDIIAPLIVILTLVSIHRKHPPLNILTFIFDNDWKQPPGYNDQNL
jgi:hypothetical protein